MAKLLDNMEELELRKLEQAFCGPISVRSFDDLKTLDVKKCGGLKILFLLSIAGGLPQLEEMTIRYCQAMQQILAYDQLGESEIKEDDQSVIRYVQA